MVSVDELGVVDKEWLRYVDASKRCCKDCPGEVLIDGQR